MVCKVDYEERHPQDLLKSIPDNPSVPWTRPDVAMTASTYTDPITGVVTTIDPADKHVTFGPVDPTSL